MRCIWLTKVDICVQWIWHLLANFYFSYAYILYETSDAAKKAIEEFGSQRVEFKGKPLDIHSYREPVAEIPRSM